MDKPSHGHSYDPGKLINGRPYWVSIYGVTLMSHRTPCFEYHYRCQGILGNAQTTAIKVHLTSYFYWFIQWTTVKSIIYTLITVYLNLKSFSTRKITLFLSVNSRKKLKYQKCIYNLTRLLQFIIWWYIYELPNL